MDARFFLQLIISRLLALLPCAGGVMQYCHQVGLADSIKLNFVRCATNQFDGLFDHVQ